MARSARTRQRSYAFPPEMTQLMECVDDVHFTVSGTAGRGLLALGHGDAARILAVFDGYAREAWGQAGVAGDQPADAEQLVRTWAKPVADCGQTGDMCHGSRDCEACASPDWAQEYRVRHDHSCWLCAAIKDAPWWWTGLFDEPTAHAGQAGYLPVTVWRDPADVALEVSWTSPDPAVSDAA